MSRTIGENEALEILGLQEIGSKEELEDAYEAKCFEVRQKTLHLIVVPRVMKKRYEELHRLGLAFKTLTGEKLEMPPEPSFDATLPYEKACERLGAPPPWSFSLRAYEKGMGRARLKVANAFSAPELAEGIGQALPIQQSWHALLHASFAQALRRELPISYDQEVKATQATYTGRLLKGLEQLEEKGLGRKGLEGAVDELERIASEGGGGTKEALEDLLTEVQRVDQLIRLDERKTL